MKNKISDLENKQYPGSTNEGQKRKDLDQLQTLSEEELRLVVGGQTLATTVRTNISNNH